MLLFVFKSLTGLAPSLDLNVKKSVADMEQSSFICEVCIVCMNLNQNYSLNFYPCISLTLVSFNS